MSNNKLQYLLIQHLQKYGCIKLLLPDGVILEVGINQLDNQGKLKSADNYCWVMATREDRMAILDSYNLGLRYADNKNSLVFEDKFVTSDGQAVCRVDVV